MKLWTVSLAIAGCALLANTAHADQCQWNQPAHAAKAQAILAKHNKVIEYCEPCGDNAPGTPFIAKTVTITTPQDAFREININGKGVDLAYTYVQITPTKYKNLAKLAGCPADGVSAALHVADETPTGVLITADEPAEQPAPLPIAIAAPPCPSPPPPPAPTITYHTTTIHQPVPWFMLALVGAGGFLSGVGFTVGAMTLRRRRSMRPRATDLPNS